MKTQRGATLIEVLIGSSILMLLTAASFATYAMGLKSWMKIDDKTTVIAKLQLVCTRVSNDLKVAEQSSVSVGSTARSFAVLTPGPKDSITVDPGGRVEWKTFAFYYYQPSTKELFRREIPYTTSDPTHTATLEAHTGQPLSSFENSGRRIASEITDFEIIPDTPPMFRLRVEAESGDHTSELVSTVRLQDSP